MPIFYLAVILVSMVAGFTWSAIHDYTAFGYFLTYLAATGIGSVVSVLYVLLFPPFGDEPGFNDDAPLIAAE